MKKRSSGSCAYPANAQSPSPSHPGRPPAAAACRAAVPRASAGAQQACLDYVPCAGPGSSSFSSTKGWTAGQTRMASNAGNGRTRGHQATVGVPDETTGRFFPPRMRLARFFPLGESLMPLVSRTARWAACGWPWRPWARSVPGTTLTTAGMTGRGVGGSRLVSQRKRRGEAWGGKGGRPRRRAEVQ